jgi:hypothetical protein
VSREFNRQENKQRDMEAEIRRLEDLVNLDISSSSFIVHSLPMMPREGNTTHYVIIASVAYRAVITPHVMCLTISLSQCHAMPCQSRVLQVDGSDRSHSESRLKAELSAADHRVQQLEADNSTLRRRALEVAEGTGTYVCVRECVRVCE